MIDKNSKIVISGANGAVGELLYDFFKEDNYQVEKLDLSSESKKDVFIHLAAKAVKSDEILNSNINYLKECITYCKKVGIKYFVFFSTMSVYGNINQLNVNENSNLSNDITIYGLSKLLGENLLKEEELKVLNLRVPAILTKRSENTFIYKLYEKIVKNEEITLTNYDKPFNTLIDVKSIYNFILTYDFKIKNDTYNLAIDKNKTLEEITFFLKEKFDSSSKIIQDDNKRNFYNIDTNKASINYSYKQRDSIEALEEWINLLKVNN